jgi:hypothetical protein
MINLIMHQLGEHPPSCGPISSADYLAFKIWSCKLWQFREHQVAALPIKPIRPIRLGEHKTPPRVRDTVLYEDQIFGDKVGTIVSIDRASETAVVFFFKDRETDSFSLDQFQTNRGRIRWLIG